MLAKLCKYCKLMPPKYRVGGLCSNIQVVSCICSPPMQFMLCMRLTIMMTATAFWKNCSFVGGEHLLKGGIFPGAYSICICSCILFQFFIDMHCVPLYCSGLEELENAGLQYLDSVFSEPGRSGALLICGLASSSGSGCGKSSLAKLLCKSASRPPYCAHVSMIDCTSLRGRV